MGSDTLLEQCRKLHSEAEHLKKMAAKVLMRDPKGFRDGLRQDELVNGRLQKVVDNSKKLLEIYKDENEVLKEELQEIAGRNAFHVFYTKVRDMKKPENMGTVFSFAPKPDEVDVTVNTEWSGAEWRGRFVDLHSAHQAYTNLKNVKRLSYKKFLRTFHHFHRVPQKDAPYVEYLRGLANYFHAFWDKQNPLYPHTRVLQLCTEEFNAKWEKKTVQGYQVPFEIKTLEEIEAKSVGGDKIHGPQVPEPLPDPNLFCVETQKWFNNEGSLNSHKRGKKFKKAKARGQDVYKEQALLEAICSLYAGLLKETIDRSVDFVEKRQTKTYEEIKREIEEAENAADSSEDEEDDEQDFGVIYNPLKIPLDFDGKPIPYWLYKFRGLNRYFKCQICGNREYRGPMSFEQHFSEWRHAHGMRTLGIPNTKDFMWITDINDAIALWSKIKDRKKDAVWNPADEEVEDIEGNVFNRPTFDNLQYQNLIQV